MLDAKDEALLLALERNARMSVVALAHRVGLSRSATQERLARLERTGAIGGYTIVRNPDRPANGLKAWLMVRHAAEEGCSGLISKIRTLAEVRSLYALAGQPDLLVEVEAGTAAKIDEVAEMVRKIPGITGVSTHLVLASHTNSAAGLGREMPSDGRIAS